STWSFGRPRVPHVLALHAGDAAALFLAAFRPSIALVAVGAFWLFACNPLNAATDQAIWQRVVPPDLHGRVLATRWLIVTGAIPVAFAAAGPLAEHVFEPAATPGSPLANILGATTGLGPGRGIALMFLALGALKVIVAGVCAAIPAVRRLDELGDKRA